MGKMKEKWMDEMERLEDLYRAEQLIMENSHEANDREVEVAQEEGRLEDRLEEAQGQEDQLSGKD